MPKKIALLHYTAPPVVGGVESVLAHHARLMASDGFQVCIIAARGTAVNEHTDFVHLPLADSRHPDVLAAKTQMDQGEAPADFEQLVSRIQGDLWKALAGVDIVIAHNVCSLHKNLALTVALRRVCAMPDAPRLIIWHHDLAWMTPRYQLELHEGWPWDLLRTDWPDVNPIHVVVSELRRSELAALTGLKPETSHVIPSGMELSTFLKLEPETVEIAQQLRLFQADPLILLPVRITRRKNIELAVRTVAAMKDNFPQTALVITGPPGPHNPTNRLYFQELKDLRSELALNPTGADSETAVYFLAEIVNEYLPDRVIGDFYRLADALLLPSREEGFGIPMLEAALVGLPIFCADISPLRAIAGDKAAYFSPDIHPVTLANDIKNWLLNDDIYQLRRHVRQNYTWKDIYRKRIAPLLENEK